MNYNIAVIPGDGIGPDIVEQAVKVMHKVGDKFGHTFTTKTVLAGGAAIDATGASFLATNDKSEKRWTELGGGKVEREQLELATDAYGFTCDLLSTTWETGRTDANFYAWTTLGTDDAGTYYLHVEVTDGYNDGMGFSKNADITPDEFVAYLNAAMPSKLTTE